MKPTHTHTHCCSHVSRAFILKKKTVEYCGAKGCTGWWCVAVNPIHGCLSAQRHFLFPVRLKGETQCVSLLQAHWLCTHAHPIQTGLTSWCAFPIVNSYWLCVTDFSEPCGKHLKSRAQNSTLRCCWLPAGVRRYCWFISLKCCLVRSRLHMKLLSLYIKRTASNLSQSSWPLCECSIKGALRWFSSCIKLGDSRETDLKNKRSRSMQQRPRYADFISAVLLKLQKQCPTVPIMQPNCALFSYTPKNSHHR